MKKLLILFYLLIIVFCGFAQSSGSIKDKYPDDMYTELNGKEVRVNTLPKKIIDSLEALPPAQQMLAIYKIEKTDKAGSMSTPSETHKVSEFDYWQDKRVDRIYNVYRNGDGTTKVEDNDGNWMLFKTEYVTNEYTGENTGNPVNGRIYCGFDSSRRVKLISACRRLPNGYILEVNKNRIKMSYEPLSITYNTMVQNITSKIWYEWISETNFDASFSNYFKNSTITNMNGHSLLYCANLIFKTPGGGIVYGGYLDTQTNTMYYPKDIVNKWGKFAYCCPNGFAMKLHFIKDEKESLNEMDNVLSYIKKLKEEYASLVEKSKDRKAQIRMTPQEKSMLKYEIEKKKSDIQKAADKEYKYKNNCILVYGLPTDKIKEYKSNDNVSEIYYDNGDYLKLSKRQKGAVFECKMHRPYGVWTVGLNNNMKATSEFTFTKGKLKGLIYKDPFEYSDGGQCLSCYEMVHPQMMKQIQYDGTYDPRLFQPSKNRWVHINGKGIIKEFEDERLEAQRNSERKVLKAQEESIYKAYCAKYGKANVDEILYNKNIKSGMPFSVVNALCNCTLTNETPTIKLYRIWYNGCTYDLKNKKIVPNKITDDPFAKRWMISVSNGMVNSVNVR